uniref:Uncharacterized protein n=1 Tax=mine drainage metagenome TaxID=410659 RepID=E6PX62_9ZZZZ
MDKNQFSRGQLYRNIHIFGVLAKESPRLHCSVGEEYTPYISERGLSDAHSAIRPIFTCCRLRFYAEFFYRHWLFEWWRGFLRHEPHDEQCPQPDGDRRDYRLHC